jgi:translation initiation factor 1 (eIF-1/SUI1)
VIQIQGDKRRDVVGFLMKYNICNKDEIKVHGA